MHHASKSPEQEITAGGSEEHACVVKRRQNIAERVVVEHQET
jgi:hypothetical protein